MSLEKLKDQAEILKKANSFEVVTKAKPALEAAFEVIIDQAEQIENLTNCVNFLQKTIDGQVNSNA